MKTYEILITAFTTVVVEAEDQEQALEWAGEEVRLRGMERDEMKVEQELKTEHEIKRAVECSEYHSDDFQKIPYQAYPEDETPKTDPQ